MEAKIVKVFLFRQNKWFNCQTSLEDLKKGDVVLVASNNGLEAGRVLSLPESFEEKTNELFKVVRLQTQTDEKTREQFELRENGFLIQAKELVKKMNLNLKVSEVFLSLDNEKAVISFTAEDRVDFRNLLKELAKNFKTKIELRQIGTRDEVKLIGALGPCGKVCCCSNHLNNFCPVSIKMAKTQNLSLNPNSISGICGKLMCCLSYENEHYTETSNKMPKLGTKVLTPDGQGICVFNNLLKETVDVKFFKSENDFEVKSFAIEKITF